VILLPVRLTVRVDGSTVYTQCPHAVAIAPDGTIYVVLYKYGTGVAYNIYVYYSKDNGKTWTEELVHPNAVTIRRGLSYAIATDSLGNVHLVYEDYLLGDYDLYYIKRDVATNTWGTPVVIESSDTYDPDIAVDSLDTVHIIYCYGSSSPAYTTNIHYQTRDADGNWGTIEEVTTFTAGEHQYHPKIVIDENNDVHIVWNGLGWGTNTTRQNIQYRKRTSSGWQTQVAITDYTSNVTLNHMAIDKDSNIHLSWKESRDNYYKKLDAVDGWQDSELVSTATTSTASTPVCCVDRQGRIYLVYTDYVTANGAHYKHYFLIKRGTGWFGPITLSWANDYVSRYFRPLNALHPIVAGESMNIPARGLVFAIQTNPWPLTTPSVYTVWYELAKVIEGNVNIDQLYFQHAERMGKFA